LIGQHPKLQKPYGIRRTLENELIKHKSIYTEQSDIQISVLTWNCAGQPPPSHDFDVKNILYD